MQQKCTDESRAGQGCESTMAPEKTGRSKLRGMRAFTIRNGLRQLIMQVNQLPMVRPFSTRFATRKNT